MLFLDIGFPDISAELAVIAKAPIPFIAVCLIAIPIIWAIVRSQFKQALDLMRESRDAAIVLKATFRDQLEISTKENVQLQEGIERARVSIVEVTNKLHLSTAKTISALNIGTPSYTEKDWRDLRYRLEQVAGKNVGAKWNSMTSPTVWTIQGGYTADDNLDVESLCRHAGMMLTKSPKVWDSVNGSDYPEIKLEADPLRRWLFFLKSRQILGSIVVTSANKQETDRKGFIVDLVAACIRACTDNATAEA